MPELKVLALASDSWGCGFYRVREPARVTRAAGIDVTVSGDLPIDGRVFVKTGDAEINRINTDANLIVMQRPTLRAFLPAIDKAHQQGIAVAVDIDDNLSRVHPENAAYPGLVPERNVANNYTILEQACLKADLVITSTPALARHYAPHGRFVVLRNKLPERIFGIQKHYPERPRLGWTGSVSTHPRDLEETGPHVATVLQSTGASLSVIGDGDSVREKLRLAPQVPVEITGWIDLANYYDTIARYIDVGIVPLEDSEFNHGKSYLKALEYSALGIPSVVSPTEEYLEFARQVPIAVARKARDWQKPLRRWLTDRDALMADGDRARSAVRTLTYENHAEDWINAWTQALEYRAHKRLTGKVNAG